MSRYGIKAGGESVFSIKNPLAALELIKKIVAQWNGPKWTQHKPNCPLCDEELQDCERHMNQPVGECANKDCESRIYAADYFGKITDILEEWLAEQDDWVEEMEKKIKRAKVAPGIQYGTGGRTTGGSGGYKKPAHKTLNQPALADIDEEEIFIW